jgi:hypothetical protein
MADFKAAKTPS